ncbi:MAG: hypothetical protein ISP41_03600, partial [Alphaproteobacteria bacterium]|nr:hypothetical protein [Alphaproteobacteria bacterium]
ANKIVSDGNTADISSSFSQGQSFRLASRTEASVFAVDLRATGRETEGVGEALSGTFEELLEIFHGNGKASEALENALSSVSDLIDAAGEDADVLGVQLRVTSVVRSFGAENGEDAAFGSVTGFAIEVGLVRGDRVSAEDTRLVGLAGDLIDLNVAQRRTGIVNGVYQIQDKVPFSDEVAAFQGQNRAQVEALRNALDRLTLVQDALKSYRNGDTRALEEVEKFFRSGTLDAGAVRAISDVRGTSQTLVPGAGIFNLS